VNFSWESANKMYHMMSFHDCEYEGVCLLGCCVLQHGRSVQTFQRCLLPPSSGPHINLQECLNPDRKFIPVNIVIVHHTVTAVPILCNKSKFRFVSNSTLLVAGHSMAPAYWHNSGRSLVLPILCIFVILLQVTSGKF
jgi:hypothetical protein